MPTKRNYFLEVTGLLFWALSIPLIPILLLSTNNTFNIYDLGFLYILFFIIEMLIIKINQEE